MIPSSFHRQQVNVQLQDNLGLPPEILPLAFQWGTWAPISQRSDAPVNILKSLPNVLKAADSDFALALI